MRHKEIELLFAYMVNNQIRLENEKKQLQSNIRYRDIDEVDCMELLIASVRLETFKEVTRHIRQLLKINFEEVEEDEEKI
ncbi:MAG: hypothetical protein IJ666_09060 [Ruminococcus sp.]|nr:hypothetical protein [Ruminococcus sp.]